MPGFLKFPVHHHQVSRVFIYCLALAATVWLSVSARTAAAASLADRIGYLLRSDPAQLNGAQISISIVQIAHGTATPIYGYHPNLPLMPGSNGKLLTTSAAFAKLGPDGVLHTYLYRVGDDLVMMGGGDPALGDPVLCRRVGWTVTTAFDNWAAYLKRTGQTNFHDVVVDDHIFNQNFFNRQWPKGQSLDWYEAQVCGLNFSDNCLNWLPMIQPNGAPGVRIFPSTPYTPVTIQARRGSVQSVWLYRRPNSNHFFLRGQIRYSDSNYPLQVTINNPALYTGAVLKQSFLSHGIAISGVVRSEGITALAAQKKVRPVLLASYGTPLTDILKRAHIDSFNLMAECLCKLLGHDATGQPGSWANGTAAVKAYLGTIGVNPALTHMVDGSGLSHHDRVATSAITTILARIATEPHGQVFIDTMAKPGQGTFVNRLTRSPARAFLRVKDGHVTGASTLSGYLTLAHARFAFAIFVNHYRGNVNGWEDQVVNALYNSVR